MNTLTVLLQALAFIVALILIRGGSWVWVLILIVLFVLVYLSERAAKKRLPTDKKVTPPQGCQPNSPHNIQVGIALDAGFW